MKIVDKLINGVSLIKSCWLILNIKSRGSLPHYHGPPPGQIITCEHVGRVPGRGLRVSVSLSQLGLLQGGRVLDEEHQAADQHLSVQSLRLHLDGVDQEVDDPGLQVVEVSERLVAVSSGHQLLDGHVGKLERKSQERLQQVDGTPPEVSSVDGAEEYHQVKSRHSAQPRLT